MLGITLPAAMGYPLLALCALLFIIGLGMLLWPMRRKPKVADEPKWPETPAAFTGLGKNMTMKNVAILAHDRPGMHIDGEGHAIDNVQIITISSGDPKKEPGQL